MHVQTIHLVLIEKVSHCEKIIFKDGENTDDIYTNMYLLKRYYTNMYLLIDRSGFVYKGVPSAHVPVAHSDALPIPKYPSDEVYGYDSRSQTEKTPSPPDDGSDYIPIGGNLPSLISQEHLDSIVRKLNLSHNNAMILASELNSVHVLAPGVKITAYKHRQDPFMPYFTLSEDATYAYCIDIPGLMNEMGISLQS